MHTTGMWSSPFERNLDGYDRDRTNAPAYALMNPHRRALDVVVDGVAVDPSPDPTLPPWLVLVSAGQLIGRGFIGAAAISLRVVLLAVDLRYPGPYRPHR